MTQYKKFILSGFTEEGLRNLPEETRASVKFPTGGVFHTCAFFASILLSDEVIYLPKYYATCRLDHVVVESEKDITEDEHVELSWDRNF